MGFLKEIRPKIQDQIRKRRSNQSLESIKSEIEPGDHRFSRAVESSSPLALIAEFKKSSPSRGSINTEASLADYMERYDRYADAVSILTEPEYFGGSPSLIREARRHTERPLLRKDFIIDPYQVYEARSVGADAVLLIEGMLADRTLRDLIALTDELGMDALVECHDREGLERILDTDAPLIGINNRNLVTLEIDRDRTRRLVSTLSERDRDNRLIVAESGLSTRADLLAVEEVADAVLVGTAIMDAPDPERKLKELTGRTLVKFCGITTESDATAAVDAGADVLGLNFYEGSSRYIERDTAETIADRVRGDVLLAGVFVNANVDDVASIADRIGLDLIQFSGEESPEDIRDARKIGLPIIRAVHLDDRADLERIDSSDADYLMVDARVEGRYGGTGERVDDDLIENGPLDPRTLVIAGGLTPENAGAVQRKFNPVMLDVCSGIESEPGRKDREAMDAFVAAVSEEDRT